MHRSLRETLTYFLTIAAGQALSYLLLPVVTNYLSPGVFGDYALALSVSSLVGTLGSTWIRNVGLRLFYDARSEGFTRRFYVSTALFQAAVVALLFVGAAVVVAAFGHYVSPALILAAGASVIAGDFFALSVALLRAEQDANRYAISEIASALVRFGLTLLGLAVGIREPSLLFLSAAVASALLGGYAARALHAKLTGPARFDSRVVRALVVLGPASIPFSIAGWAERLLDRIILDRFLTRAVVGVYSANYSIGERIIGGLVQAVFLMGWPDILRSWADGGKEKARAALTRAVGLYLWLTVGPAVFMALFHRELALLLGPEYRQGSEIMAYVAGATWLQGFTTYLNRHLELNKRFGVLSWIAFGGAGLNLALNLILIPWIGTTGAALATLASFAAKAILYWFIRDRELVRLPADTILSVALLVVAALGLSRVPSQSYQRLAVFVVVYAAGAAWFVLRRFGKKQVSLA